MPGSKTNNTTQLIDRFGRVHSYLRLSITDKCNFACSYCRPDLKMCEVKKTSMSIKEITEMASAFVDAGIKKIRLTGGEPSVHNDFEEIISELGKLPVELAITTNGYLLDKHFNTLKASGVKKLNISLDTLKSDRFKSITKRNAFERVYANLALAIKLGFEVKLNAVIMRGTNEDEILDFARLCLKYPLTVRFIEFMPFRDNNWNFGKTFSRNEMFDILSAEFSFIQEERKPGNTSDYFQIKNAPGKIGMISTLSHPFCSDCNRIRVLSDGSLKNCLFENQEYDLLTPFREGKSFTDIIHTALGQKHAQHGGNKPIGSDSTDYLDNRNMYSIGG
jgi:GTP 3',8-cyclase